MCKRSVSVTRIWATGGSDGFIKSNSEVLLFSPALWARVSHSPPPPPQAAENDASGRFVLSFRSQTR